MPSYKPHMYVCMYIISQCTDLALHVVSWDDEARGSGIHDGRRSVLLLRIRFELQKLNGVIQLVTELERRRSDDEVLRRQRCVCVCVRVGEGWLDM